MASFRAEMVYFKQLADAGWNGVTAARREFTGPLIKTGTMWRPAAMGAAIGIVGSRLTGSRRGKSATAMAGLAGGAVASAVLMAWTSRRFARAATTKAIRSVNAVRDQHWLAANPIDYA